MLRFTTISSRPRMSGDLTIDASAIMAIVEDEDNEDGAFAILMLWSGAKFCIEDKDRTAAKRWAEARGDFIHEED